MKTDLALRLSKDYPFFWQSNVIDLPDGWVRPLIDMWERLYRLSAIDATSDRAIIPVVLRYEIYPSSAMAFASPTMSSSWWTDARRKEAFEALDDFHGATKTTCCLCGSSGAYLHRPRRNGTNHQRILCEGCGSVGGGHQ